MTSQRIRVRDGVSLGKVYDPYFNRTYEHFCSHQHTPFRPEPSGYDAGVMSGRILYFAHPVFSIYRAYGAVIVKEFIVNAIRRFMGEGTLLSVSGLPSQGRVTLMRQREKERYVLHLLYANTILRGGEVTLDGGTRAGRSALEVIEDLNPAGPVRIELNLPESIRSVRLVPEGMELAFARTAEGAVAFDAPAFTCHSMIELSYGN